MITLPRTHKGTHVVQQVLGECKLLWVNDAHTTCHHPLCDTGVCVSRKTTPFTTHICLTAVCL